MIDTIFASDNLLRFRKNLLERILKLIITIGYKIKYEKLQYDINREAGRISASSSSNIGKYEYLLYHKNFQIKKICSVNKTFLICQLKDI